MPGTPRFFATAEDGLRAELDMLDAVHRGETGPASALIWQARQQGLVAPASFARDKAVFDTAAARSSARGWPLYTRRSGGGLTPQGPGVLNLALCFCQSGDRPYSIPDVYERLCDLLCGPLSSLGIDATPGAVAHSFCDGDHNLQVGGRKLVGTAQRWRGGSALSRGGAVLAHALILTDLDIAPAVAAIAAVSGELGHDTVFDARAHTSLATLLTGWSDPAQAAFCSSLANALTADGFRVV